MANGAQTWYLSMVLNFNKKVTDDYLSNSVNEMKGGNTYYQKKIKEKPVYIHAIQDVVNRKQEKADRIWRSETFPAHASTLT